MTDPQLNFFTTPGTSAQRSPSGLCPRGVSRNTSSRNSTSRNSTSRNSPSSRSKYGNRATGTHASRKEHRRALELQLLERAGHITNLRQQVPFQLIPAQYEQSQQQPPPTPCTPPAPATSCGAPGATLPKPGPVKASGPSKKPRLLERPCTYIADFVYTDPTTGRQIVEDTKGMRTEVYKIKRKLMLYIHGIRIKET